MKNVLHTSKKRPLYWKGLLGLLIILLSTTYSKAQGWKHTYPTSLETRGYAVALSPDGGYLSGGWEADVDSDLYLLKVDADGVKQWNKSFGSASGEVINKIVPTPDEGYLFTGFVYLNSELTIYVIKVDAFGEVLWENTYGQGRGRSIKPTHDGGYLVIGDHEDDLYIFKIDENGTVIWEQSYPYTNFYVAFDLIANEDSTFTALAITSDDKNILQKIDGQGNLIWSQLIEGEPSLAFSKTPDGGYMLAGNTLIKTDVFGNLEWSKEFSPSISYATDIISNADSSFILTTYHQDSPFFRGGVAKIDALGNTIWSKEFTNFNNPSRIDEAVATNDGHYVLSGFEFYGSGSSTLLVKLDQNGIIYDNLVQGNVFHNNNNECGLDTITTVLENWLVKLEGDRTYYAYTNDTGYYRIEAPAGDFLLSVVAPSPLWKDCQTDVPVQFTQYDTTIIDFPEKAIAFCPFLQVDVSSSRLLRCFENHYTVSYQNQGTISATNAFIELNLDPFLTLNSSTIPWSSQIGNTYIFPVGDVPVNESSSFDFVATVSCDAALGQTHCVEAHIYPDDHCQDPLPSWDGSITTVEVACEADSVVFTISNTGAGDMATPQDYFVVEDNLIMKTGIFQLLSGGQKEVKAPANGSTYRIYAEQAPGYFIPGYKPTVAIEGCGLNPTTNDFSRGFITQFSEDDHHPYLSIDCHENRGSFDPNDKRAEPAGYEEEHYITRDDLLDYHIRFQNTGTDTAYTVVIRDTLSQHLDLSSLSLGSSSHNYELAIINGNVLKFTFNNIHLPDSTTNESASHGFVKYKIDQAESLPLGTVIYNSAAIYFDYNSPVITNQTHHTIGENFVPIILSSDELPDPPSQAVSVTPNPFQNHADFTVEGASGEKEFRLFDTTGRLVYSASFSGQNFRFYNKGLNNGLYLYTVWLDGQLLGSGKLVRSVGN